MALHVALHHLTQYRYDRPVSLPPHLIRFRPADGCSADALAACAGGAVLEHSISPYVRALGNRSARPIHAAALSLVRFARSELRTAGLSTGVVCAKGFREEGFEFVDIFSHKAGTLGFGVLCGQFLHDDFTIHPTIELFFLHGLSTQAGNSPL